MSKNRFQTKILNHRQRVYQLELYYSLQNIELTHNRSNATGFKQSIPLKSMILVSSDQFLKPLPKAV